MNRRTFRRLDLTHEDHFRDGYLRPALERGGLVENDHSGQAQEQPAKIPAGGNGGRAWLRTLDKEN